MSRNPLYGVSGSFTQGELEGTKPASNRIKCRAKPCPARRAWSEATIFVPQGGDPYNNYFAAIAPYLRRFHNDYPRRSLGKSKRKRCGVNMPAIMLAIGKALRKVRHS